MASIRKRKLPSGEIRWQCDYRDGAGARRSRQFDTRKEADAFLVGARHELSAGIHTADGASITVKEAAALWLARCESNAREATTIKQYRSHVDIHIVPRIGADRLSRLTTPKLEAFADGLVKDLSRPLARKVLVSVKSMIRDSQRRGLIAHNPALPVRIDAPTRHEEAIKIPTKRELQDMLAKVPQGWRPLLVTAILTGLRTSELRALTWDHVDLDAKVLHVRQRADAFNKIGSPKSRAGRRDVPLSPLVVNSLKEWRPSCPAGRLNLVFPNTHGTLMQPPDILRRCWYPLLKACGLVEVAPELDERGEPRLGDSGEPIVSTRPIYDFHHLRHAAASLLIEQGAQPKRIQVIMGHSSIKVTYDVYGHLFADADADQKLVAAAERELIAVGGSGLKQVASGP